MEVLLANTTATVVVVVVPGMTADRRSKRNSKVVAQAEPKEDNNKLRNMDNIRHEDTVYSFR